ncbi:MAG TPA: amidohydrolase family protein [Thermomicrobiaceae bacterium]|nr:amidohydrolase family protein [Thermomicrobiaceae bacterium]
MTVSASIGGPFDTVVRGGEIVVSSGSYPADIGIRDGRIAAIAAPEAGLRAPEVIDAAGRFVLPGFIDPHFHFKCHSHHLDTLPVALESAALGGITTALAMLIPNVDTPLRPLELIEEFQAFGEREAVIDFGFHVHLPEIPGALEQIEAAVAAGHPSFKLFLAYKSIGRMASDAHLLATMEAIAAAGGTLLVHAEDGELIDRRIAQQIARGRIAPRDFLFAHPAEAEYLAVEKALDLARLTGCPLVILHISTARAVERIQQAKAEGQAVWVETCPQYLELSDDLLRRFGPLAKVSPPLRAQADAEALWRDLIAGRIDFVGSDHSPHSAESKRGGYGNIFDCWYGAPGVQTMLPVMHDAAHKRGQPLSALARWHAEQPARAYGLYPRKGVIQVGSDADLVIWDAEKEVTIRAEDQHGQSGYTLYEGRGVRGWPVMTLVRGQVVLDDGRLRVERGSGSFIPR